MFNDDPNVEPRPWSCNVTATSHKGSIAHASHGVIWRFGSTSDHESDSTANSQPPSPHPIIDGVAAATPPYRPFSDYCAPYVVKSQDSPKDAGDWSSVRACLCATTALVISKAERRGHCHFPAG